MAQGAGAGEGVEEKSAQSRAARGRMDSPGAAGGLGAGALFSCPAWMPLLQRLIRCILTMYVQFPLST